MVDRPFFRMFAGGRRVKTENNRILIIDDNPGIHADFRKVLVRGGSNSSALAELEEQLLGESASAEAYAEFELVHAHQGEEGLKLFAEAKKAGTPFFAAFVDMRMPPGWDGLRTIKEIRKIDNEATTVICTAFSDHSWDEICKQVKVLDKLLILKKPFDPEEVQSIARSLRERWMLLKQAQMREDELEAMVNVRTCELEVERSKDKLRMEELEVIVASRTTDLRKLAMNDALTGLPNRVFFYDRLLKAIERREKDASHQYAVMFLDFDRFKVINDSLGHECGDKLLRAISERLNFSVTPGTNQSRSGVESFAARLGGDEFCVLMEGFTEESVVISTAQKLLDVLSRPYELNGHQVSSTSSIGITFSRFGYRNAEDVLRDADTAMYAAKSAGRGKAVVFDQTMHERAMRRLVLENDLIHAIKRNELSLWYHPILSLETRMPVGAEALIRCHHPVHGMISPMDFIPLAEETGLIVPIGAWVFEQSARELSRFPQLGYLSINVSRRQICDPNFIDPFNAALARTGVDPQRLICEITETALTSDPESAQRSIDHIRERGIRVFVDDFGTGSSSLGCLRRFSFDGIKLDRSFLDDRIFTRRTAAVIHSAITLAHDLEMQLIAEGVESLEQVAMLQALTCEKAQGFLFSRPVPHEDLEAQLRAEFPQRRDAA